MAGFGTFGVLLGFWVIGWGAEFAGGNLRTVLQYLSITEHMDTFSRGLIDTKDLVYYAVGDRARAVPDAAVARVEAVAGVGREPA